MRLPGGIRGVTFGLALAFTRPDAAIYYVDCTGGDDRAGTSAETAWQSLSKASSASLGPGDQLLLKRGCLWTGPLTLDGIGSQAAPIRVAAYGTGADPEIHDGNPANVLIKGRWLEAESLAVRSRPAATDTGCREQPVGSRSGFTFASGASDNTLRHVVSTGHSMGIWMAPGSRRNRVLHSIVKDNVSLTVNDKANPDNDAGAFGILINGDSNEVAYSDFSNNLAWCSYDYGIDGASVEIYAAKGNRIHHNRSREEGTFTELGGARTADNVFARNLVTSAVEACIFLNVRGAASKWGPNLGTVAVNNTVYLTGAQSQGVICGDGCGPDILDLRNNLIWAGWKGAYVDGQPRESNNIFWKTGGNPLIQNLTLHATSRKADPLFEDVAKGDFRLAPGSPALDAGDPMVAPLGGGVDLNGNPVPLGAGLDIGGFERPTGTRMHSKTPPGTGPSTRFERIWFTIPGTGAQAVDARGSAR